MASPALDDPNFHRTVVLTCAHEKGGAFGIVLNRPIELDVPEHLSRWHRMSSQPKAIFFGGPVGTGGAFGIGLKRSGTDDFGWTAVTDRIGVFDLGGDPEDMGVNLEQMRIFRGHAGWLEGQIEAELARESWFVVELDDNDPFSDEPERLWTEVLRRQTGPLAIYADFPVDPKVN